MRSLRVVFIFLIVAALALSAVAEPGSGVVRGQVTDPSGAVVVQATITAKSADGKELTTTSTKTGAYELKGLAPGKYTITATFKGFSPFQAEFVEVTAGEPLTLDIQLGIEALKEQVTVEDRNTNVEVSPTNNASAIVLKGKDLDALSDDPDQLESDLQALAGPSAGPNGGQIYIDGFTNGQLPPKASIREIRVNQNPFSAQYDHLGYGRVEIFTKPGMDKFHGQFMFNENNSIFNSRSPFAPPGQPDYHSEMYNGNFSGPLSKRASFNLNFERRDINDNALINAVVLDNNFNPVNFSQAISNPRVRTSFSPRLDYQLTPNNTLTARYQYTTVSEQNDGIGDFSLASQGFNRSNTNQNLQISDTQVIGAKVVNETRFQVSRDRSEQSALSNTPTIAVQGAFTSGGNRVGQSADHNERYELQNYTSMALGKHFVKFGGRLRVNREMQNSPSNFNGRYTFDSIDAYGITEQGLALGWTPAQIRAAGGGASQYSVITGIPTTGLKYVDTGLYAEDDWRIRPNLTLSYGLRFESQNWISDHADLAPRVGVAWGLGSSKSAPKTVLRAGFGMFYDRFDQNLVLQTLSVNGLNQQGYTVVNPDFYPTAPAPATLGGPQAATTIYTLSPKLQAPYLMQYAFTLERQITKTATASVTYVHSRGVHWLNSMNINAPLPGTYDPNVPGSGVHPLGNNTNVYEYQSEGTFKQKQLIANANVRGKVLSLFGFYTLNFANSDTSGAGSFPSTPYNLAADYGRANFDVRHRMVVGGNFNLPYRFAIAPFIIASSGQPFNFTLGQDLNGDSIFNDRPTIAAADSLPGTTVATPWGTFDKTQVAGHQFAPMNAGTGSAFFMLNMRLAKSFGFGKENGGPSGAGAGGPRGGGDHGHGGPGGGMVRGPGPGMFGSASNRRYNVTFSLTARNLLNVVNESTPVGNLNSPLFGKSTSLAGMFGGSGSANRRVDMQVQFTF